MEFRKEDCTYTSCYCEENVWCLCDSLKSKIPGAIQNCYCVFISNKRRAIPLWKQKASRRQDGQVIWDYHVIFLYEPSESKTIVYDLDTTLTFPCDFRRYYEESIKDERCLKPEYHRMFRVIPAEEFLQTFASDRSHMLTPEGHWVSPPPTYPPIKTKECSNNIQEFISMDKNNHGDVLSLNEFLERFLEKQ
ncbi:protein N-terminal glutamine amidohydrolase-like [Crassostrea angulata]|uniref:protein N-terminal glutamine amidohydrolase-like n=1 Tax=Magallana angulata TaxID=2784310 RepID=UPI0022B0DF74|nr:protein N-terminal glutamine amidohydrolase-like [Crassostrea angulata]